MTEENRVRGRRNKARSKEDERYVADALGGKRHWADAGGDVDVETALLAVQVKGTQSVPSDRMLAALDQVRGREKLGAAVFVRHGRPKRAVIVFDLIEFANWWGRDAEGEAVAQ